MLSLSVISKDGKLPSSIEANTLTKNLLHEIEKVNNKFSEETINQWTKDIVDVVRFCVGAGEGLSWGILYALYIIKSRWDELPLEFRKAYDFQFDVLVMRETPIQPQTIDNYFRTVRTFIVDQKKPFGTVRVPKRDDHKNPVVVDGEVLIEEKEWDVTQYSVSKLTAMRPIVEAGEMTDKRWAMLADPIVTVQDIHREIYKKKTEDDPDPSLMFYLAGDVIVAKERGFESEIGHLYFDEFEKDELTYRALRRVMQALGIKFDDDIIREHNQRKSLERAYNGSNFSETNETQTELQGGNRQTLEI